MSSAKVSEMQDKLVGLIRKWAISHPDYMKDTQKPNHSGFVVIGAGLPRTGTSSLQVLSHF